jgi:hypothetical protein
MPKTLDIILVAGNKLIGEGRSFGLVGGGFGRWRRKLEGRFVAAVVACLSWSWSWRACLLLLLLLLFLRI